MNWKFKNKSQGTNLRGPARARAELEVRRGINWITSARQKGLFFGVGTVAEAPWMADAVIRSMGGAVDECWSEPRSSAGHVLESGAAVVCSFAHATR